MEQIGSRRWVLMGEATHGTHEFYALRAELTRRLIDERGFRVVAVEGDWNSCFRVNRFLRSQRRGEENPGTFPSEDATIDEAMRAFDEFPKWMWRNEETRELLQWIASFNSETSPGEPVRWYGLDLQGSLRAPAEEVVRYAERLDPEFAQELRSSLLPFLSAGAPPSELGRRLATREAGERLHAAGRGSEAPAGWQDAPHPVQLQHTLEHLLAVMQQRNRDDFAFLCPVEEALSAEQSLDVLMSAQEYYAKQYTDSAVTWNLRDQHMASTVLRLVEHLEVFSTAPQGGPPPGIIIWAHNSHIGDARATERGQRGGQWNLGHMVRETFGPDVTFLLGFTTYTGEVHAAPDWGRPGQVFPLRPTECGSWEAELHEHTLRLRSLRPPGHEQNLSGQKYADDQGEAFVNGLFWACGRDADALRGVSLPQRLVGVVYRPDNEWEAHVTRCDLGTMYDALLHVDITTAVAPIL